MTPIVKVEVARMFESGCNRTTYSVIATTAEGYTKTVDSHSTGSDYTNGVGIPIEEARDRAVCDCHEWADFLRLVPTPLVEDGVLHEPSLALETYTTERVLKARDAAPASDPSEGFPFLLRAVLAEHRLDVGMLEAARLVVPTLSGNDLAITALDGHVCSLMRADEELGAAYRLAAEVLKDLSALVRADRDKAATAA